MKVLRISVLILVVISNLISAVGQKKESLLVVSGVVKIGKNNGSKITKETIEGAIIIFTDENGKENQAKSVREGKYQINLPAGKYRIYATANEKCWMCAEYYNNDFVIKDDNKIELDILLQFYGEG